MVALNLFFRAAITVSLAIFSPESSAQEDPFIQDSAPLESELLSQPITLADCPGVKIIEWRPTPFKNETNINEKSIKVASKVCALAIKNFIPFVRSINRYAFQTGELKQSLCLMPADDSDGTKARNLNDIKFRFANRPKTFGRRGVIRDVWGYTEYATNNIYLRNDPLVIEYNFVNGQPVISYKVNPDFITVLAHEFFHAMSYQWGLYETHEYINKAVEDEWLAVEFTDYLKSKTYEIANY